ncbi:methylisocitrate lyase [Picrophilus oshimae]|uniref:Methylisocitrate lyase n=1 Tax=Picrophilus torridus (strain ATCC 700027 / DSM 9790 / JCM 10055 / NBRC 100828 / KAW 2/3) TaxID=1122961 RepID=A0A8G2L7W6_PICTO|nr:methylisocitrate lyase [Picrophilus oshimae]SMD31543.1 carboxyvinyl-carboxyphosphonate phosphorylmutase [Picrophilus oshimae DSM 9789]
MNDLLDYDFLTVPGIFNGFSARLARQSGFIAGYLSGGALTSSMGLPDLGLISLTELENSVRIIKEVSDIKIIVDADTGFGEALSVYRTFKVLERAGADAIQIEDQKMPKRCGHLDGKEIIDASNMVEKIKAADMARKNALIIARTDARGVTGIDDAIERAKMYIEAGADIIFPEALKTKDEFRYFSSMVKAPLLANMTEFGKTPFITADEFKKLGYRFVIFPVTAFRAAALAMKRCYEALYNDGTQKNIINDLMTRSDQYKVINYDFYANMDGKIADWRHANGR